MAIFLELAEGSRDESESVDTRRIFAVEGKISRIQDAIGCASHDAVIVSTAKRCPQRLIRPIGSGLRDQKMEHGIVRGRNGPPQGQLSGWRNLNELQGLCEQIVVISQLLPVGVVMAILFRFASEVEIRPQSPVFDRTSSVEKDSGNTACLIGDRVLVNELIRKNDAKEDGRF